MWHYFKALVGRGETCIDQRTPLFMTFSPTNDVTAQIRVLLDHARIMWHWFKGLIGRGETCVDQQMPPLITFTQDESPY